MQKIILLRGLPASGKTSFALKYIENNPEFKRINKDDIRAKYNEPWSKDFEKRVLEEERRKGIEYLEEGYSLIVDDTNFNNDHYNYWSSKGKLYNIPIEVKEFNVNVEECIRRDSLREKPVGEKVIRRMNNQKRMKKTDYRYRKKQDDTLDHAIICDIDGTLALMTGRSPYIPDKTDILNEEVANILRFSSEYVNIFLVSGRSEDYRELTVEWLSENNIQYHHLLMRESGDNRPDEIIKKELYEEHIKDKFYVRYILDDRDKVVRMWRDEGLLCLQVYYGDF